jgi:hypothetical protein
LWQQRITTISSGSGLVSASAHGSMFAGIGLNILGPLWGSKRTAAATHSSVRHTVGHCTVHHRMRLPRQRLMSLAWLQDSSFPPSSALPEQQPSLVTAAFPSLDQAVSGTTTDDSSAMTVLNALRQMQCGAVPPHPPFLLPSPPPSSPPSPTLLHQTHTPYILTLFCFHRRTQTTCHHDRRAMNIYPTS